MGSISRLNNVAVTYRSGASKFMVFSYEKRPIAEGNQST
uniref:Uncharacterized protein n=1 Tax=Arundo donax TaxID=35708 RepID=A0A0A9H7I3_ARUDO